MSNDTFQWTDELVAECGEYFASRNLQMRNGNASNDITKKYIESFKQSKMPKKERIEVKEVGIESILIKFEGKRLSVAKIEQVKAAIERVLNDEPKIDLSVPPYANDLLKMYEIYDNKQLKEAEEKAFNAGREWTQPLTFNYGGTSPRVLPEIKQKFATFQDYLNSKK